MYQIGNLFNLSRVTKNSTIDLTYFAKKFRTYRYGAYRQFCWFIHNKLGRGVRRVIPACAVCKIRKEYPSVDGRYTGFKGDAEGGELVEMDFSWIAEIEDE